MSIYSQLNDLYQLQIAARELEHGVRDLSWRLFEPSKFVYAFFAFNSFYSIDWEETKKQNQLIKWEFIKSSNSGKEPKTESQKINEMREYIYKSYVKDNKDIEGKDLVADEFVIKLKKFLRVDKNIINEILNKIVTDSTIDDKKKNSFIKNFENLYDKNLRGNNFNRALYGLLFFVFSVRNNIFHGSKTVIEMMDDNQRDRFEVYTAILLAVNEMLFDVNEKNFNWTRNEIDKNLEDKQRLNSNRIKNKFISQTVSSKFNLEVPDGILFYPCCGDDTYEPLRLFIDTVSDFHFADNEFLPKLPKLECEIEGVLDPIRNERPMRNVNSNIVIPKVIIGNAKSIKCEDYIPNEILEQLKERNIRSTGFRNNTTITYKQEWLYTPQDGRKIEVYRHIQDGLITFMTLDKVSVFFLRGDSEGEGGSGQRWFQESIFKLILEKLVDGGLIVTDGSSSDPGSYESAIWKSLWKNRRTNKNDNPQKPEDFYYNDRKFVCIEKCGHRYGPVYVWKVIKNKH
jgi:hypothetical protein